MRVLLISTNQSFSPVPVMPSGACIVAEAARRSGHEVNLLDLMFRPDPQRTVADLLRKTDYDVIGVSVRNIDNNDMQNTEFYIRDLAALVRTIRSFSDARLVLGGAALSVMPKEIMETVGVDCGVLGEGEAVFPALLSAFERNGQWQALPGVASIIQGGFRSNFRPASATRCPVPPYDEWLQLGAYRSRFSTVPLQSKLGCRFQCVYCTYRKIEGNGYRLFDPESVSDAAERLASTASEDIEFVDNVFNDPPEHALAVCQALIRKQVRARFHSLELNPASFSDELVSVMERAGFVGMGITVESASDRVLERLRKGFDASDVRRAAGIVRRRSLPCVWIFMLGGPGETRESVQETLRFAEENIARGRDAAFFGIGVRIYPGTELESIARREGVLPADRTDLLAPVFYTAPGLDASWVRQQVRQALDRNLNFMSIDSFSHPMLPIVSRLASWLGVRPPLWRHTASIRGGLRLLGVDA